MQVKTKRHSWRLMTMTPVEVFGEGADGRPAAFHTGDTREGVNCGACGAPWSMEALDEECPGEDA